jgi:hypothetical protein
LANDLGSLGIGHVGNTHIASAIQKIIEHHPSINLEKDSFGKGFITRTKPHITRGMDHLENFAGHIGKTEMRYQAILDSLDANDVDLETKVRLEDMAKQHVIRLKSVHGKQKATLTKITQLFLQLSKSQIREMKKGRS